MVESKKPTQKKSDKKKELDPRRVAVPSTKPLHNCTFDVNLSKVSMKYFDKYVPDFLKKHRKK